MDARSDVDEETEDQRAELRGHQHLNACGIIARTRCQHCPHSVTCPFLSFLSDWRPPDFEDLKRAWQRLPSLMAENGNACTTCAYLSPTPGFFALFYYYQCLCPYSERCSDTNDGHLNKGWSLYTMYICTFCAWLNPGKVYGSVLVWNTCTTCIFLRCLLRSKYKQPIRWMDYWWSLKERALKTYTVFLHTSCIYEISICMRLNYIV